MQTGGVEDTPVSEVGQGGPPPLELAKNSMTRDGKKFSSF